MGRNGPVLFDLELLDFHFPFADQPQRHRLYPARAQTAGDRLPEEGTDLVSDETVHDAPRLLGVDFLHVDRYGLVDCRPNRPGGDLVEEHPPHFLLAVAQLAGHVPGDGLALPVGIGREEDLIGRPRRAAEVFHDLFLARDRHVFGLETVLDVDAQALGRQVPYMAHGRHDLEILAQVLLDRTGLGRGLHDNK